MKTHDDEAPMMQPSIPPSLRRLTGSSATECELQEKTLGP
jgi:hypothetical protein